MSCYSGTNIAVIYTDRAWADAWLDDFKSQVDESAILRIMRNHTCRFVICLKDGTRINAFDINNADYARGRNFHRLILEPSIMEDDDRLDYFRACMSSRIEFAYGV